MDSNEIYTTALNNALDEMRKVCPDIQHAFIYNENGELIAGDTETPQKVTTRVIDAFDDILERAEAIGGVEAITINGDMGTVKLYHFNEHYLVAVYSAKAEVGYVDTVVRVLVPTVLKVLEKLSPTPLKNEEQVKTSDEEHRGDVKPETSTPEQQAIQLMVEDFEGSRIRGLLKRSDAVYVDNETVKLWENMFNGKKIEYVEIETLNGKTTRCKVKPIKDLKYSTKGVVQIPKKIQLTLEIKKGELVLVKPIIE
jgi:predicted regulator of Ras-like GTPase activity (Roadblock/LC7/MglB family)